MDERQFKKLSDEVANRLEGVVQRGLDNSLTMAFGEACAHRAILAQLFVALMNGAAKDPQEFISFQFRAAARSLENAVIEGHGATENQIELTRRHAANVLEEFFIDLAVWVSDQARNGGAGEAAK